MLSTLPAWLAVAALTAIGGLLSAAAAALFLALPETARRRTIPHLLSFATGALLAAALGNLLPEAIEATTTVHGGEAAHRVGLLLLGGVLLFFVLEKLVLWRHCHDPNHDPGHDHGIAFSPRSRAAATLALAGDTLHNFLDGVVIAVAWLSDPALGVATAVAVFAHEIPQEIGDLAVLLHGGFSRGRALLLNTLSSLAAVAGGLVGVLALGAAGPLLPDVMVVAAASLLYVAVADLIPGLHQRVEPRAALVQLGLMSAGLGTVLLLGPSH